MNGTCRRGEYENSLDLQDAESLYESLTFMYAFGILGVFMRASII